MGCLNSTVIASLSVCERPNFENIYGNGGARHGIRGAAFRVWAWIPSQRRFVSSIFQLIFGNRGAGSGIQDAGTMPKPAPLLGLRGVVSLLLYVQVRGQNKNLPLGIKKPPLIVR